MRNLLTTAAMCAILAAGQAAAQTAATATENPSVYRNDLPETHAGFGLPALGEAAAIATGTDSREVRNALNVISTGAVEAQQFGNLATTKSASGVVRDLGDVMVLLHGEINERLDTLGEGGEARPMPERMPQGARTALDELRTLNENAFNLGFAAWVTDSYPYLIAAWERVGQADGFDALAGAVVPRLEEQLDVAEAVVAAAGDLARVDPALARTVTVPAGGQVLAADSGPTGAAGQVGERQHTPQPEQPAVQSGQNYQHDQVEVDPQTKTQAAVEGGHIPAPIAAGDIEIIDSAGVFMALQNPADELAQLRQAPNFGADRVRVVPVRQVMETTELDAIATTIGAREAEIRSIRAAIAGNDAMAGAMEQANGSLDDVIALDIIGNGAVIYTWTR